MSVNITRLSYAGWPQCYQISDGTVELVATTDVGPRLIRCGFCNEPNLFTEMPDQLGQTGGMEWKIYGGHRLWHSPESFARCYFPDNFPIKAETITNGIRLCQEMEDSTGLMKEIIVTLDPVSHHFTVEHRLTNKNNWPINFAPWALSVMKSGGVAIIPEYRKRDKEGLLPNRCISLWPYTELNDPRVHWGSRYTLVRQDPGKKHAFKFGKSVPEGWAAYANSGYLFLKKFDFDHDAAYPDFGVNVEIYTNNVFLELESIGPMETVLSGKTVKYTEIWELYKEIGEINTEEDVKKKVAPLVVKK